METLGVIALVLGLAFLAAGMVSFALNRGEPESDEKAQEKADDTSRDLFTMDNEPAEAAIEHSGATAGMDSGPAVAAHTAGN